MTNRVVRWGIWVGVALVGAVCWAMLAFSRSETINAGWLVRKGLAVSHLQ